MPADPRTIAQRALERPAGERDAFIAGACADDRDLHARTHGELARLIARPSTASLDDAPTLDAPTGDIPPHTANGAIDPEGVGAAIGPYKLLQLIGEGGFGRVFMAQQTEPIKRRVALKIIKPGMDSRQVIARFESERQALAMMDHPNIARVYDAGQTALGRPYFAMELVRGEPITAYADHQRLSTRERLELFLNVCHAVQHAHQKGIIHRDLKPSNILVTLHDATPVVKVIDFGIAKAVNQDLSDKTVFTEFRQFLGTPEYMAPEQAALSGLDVDTRADIYSLGAILYELLSGMTPFDSATLRSKGLADIQKIICEADPPRPSTRLGRTSTLGGAKTPTSGPDIARHRATDLGALRRSLHGDLDCIVMKALEKDRRRRYDTAAGLADDIARHLACEPILARPASPLYTLRKFAARNRAAVASLAVVFYAMLLALAALAYGLLEAQHERDKTAERETVARAQLVLSNLNAVRDYTTTHVRPALGPPGDYSDFKQEMVPGFGARQVFEKFRKDAMYADFVYKEAAPNPTNASNRADEWETQLVERFNRERELHEVTGVRQRQGASTFYIARPMEIKDAKCLACHTTPDTAPPKQIELYGRASGYGWKLHDVVAAQIVYVPVSEAFRAERSITPRTLGIASLASLAGVAGGLWFLLRRA